MIPTNYYKVKFSSNTVLCIFDFASIQCPHTTTHPNEENKSHGDPKGPVEIRSLEFICFELPHDIVSKVFRLMKMQKDPTHSLDNVVGVNIKIDLVRIQIEARHATSIPRKRTPSGGWLLWLLRLLLLLRSHESRRHVWVDRRWNLLLRNELLLGLELLLLLLHLRLELLLLLKWWWLPELLRLLLEGRWLRKLWLELLWWLLHQWWRLLELLLLLLLGWRSEIKEIGLTAIDSKGIRTKVIVVQRRVHHLVELCFLVWNRSIIESRGWLIYRSSTVGSRNDGLCSCLVNEQNKNDSSRQTKKSNSTRTNVRFSIRGHPMIPTKGTSPYTEMCLRRTI